MKLTEGLALQLANDIQIDSAKTSMNMVDQIPNAEVSSVAQCLSSKCKCSNSYSRKFINLGLGLLKEGRKIFIASHTPTFLHRDLSTYYFCKLLISAPKEMLSSCSLEL